MGDCWGHPCATGVGLVINGPKMPVDRVESGPPLQQKSVRLVFVSGKASLNGRTNASGEKKEDPGVEKTLK